LPWWQLYILLAFSQRASWGSHLECISFNRCALLKDHLQNWFPSWANQLCCDKVGVKDQVHIMARTAQISKEKWQSIITLRHKGQSIRKISRTLKVSSSAVDLCKSTKTIKRYDDTGSHEDPPQERKTQSYRCCRG
jgi:hypothetical protein